MELPKISVLLPSYRQPEILALTLRDLSTQRYPAEAWELVMLDDGSKDCSAELALRIFREDVAITVKRIPAGGTYSHAKLFNELIRLASPQNNIFIHLEDVRLQDDILLQHAKWHLSSEKFLVTGPMCEGPSQTFDPSACSRWPTMVKSDIISQAYHCCFQAVFAKSMSYSRALLESLRIAGDPDPFDGSMSGWGYQETEFALRAEHVGAICVYDVGCAVYHPKHNARDELNYRGINRFSMQSLGAAQNINYLCEKHGLTGLPEWKSGRPLEAPSLVYGEGDL